MKKYSVCLLTSLVWFLSIAHVSAAEKLGVSVKINGSPRVGDPVTYEAMPTGGNGNYSVGWWFDDILVQALPEAYPAWGLGLKFTNTFRESGAKKVSVNVMTIKSDGSLEEYVEHELTFTVFNSPNTAINLLSPNRDDVWEVGKAYQIKWDHVGSARKVQIAILDYRHSTEASSSWTVIAEETENDGLFEFTVPLDWLSGGNIAGQNYRVVVYPWNGGQAGISDDLFTVTGTNAIPAITVLTPKGGEIWQIGRTNTISWYSQQFDSDAEISISLTPYPVTGTAYSIARGISNAGSFSWNTGVVGEGGTLLMPSGTYTIQISAFEGGKSSGVSGDAFFTIIPPLRLANVRIWSPQSTGMVITFEMAGAVLGNLYRLEQSADMKEWSFSGLFLARGYNPGPQEMTGIADSAGTNFEGPPFRFFRLVQDWP